MSAHDIDMIFSLVIGIVLGALIVYILMRR